MAEDRESDRTTRTTTDEGGFVERALDGLLPDILQKAVSSGVRSVLATHEGVRKVAETVPKEVVRYVADQMEGMRSDIFRIISAELHDFLDRINIGQELQRVLTALTLQVTMEVRFLPNDKSIVRPDIKASVKPKRSRRSEPEPAAEAD